MFYGGGGTDFLERDRSRKWSELKKNTHNHINFFFDEYKVIL